MIELTLPPGYRADWVLSYHARDPDGPCERATPDGFEKCLSLGGTVFRIQVRLTGDAALVSVDPAVNQDDAVFAVLLVRIRRMLGLTLDAAEFEARAGLDPQVARLIGDRAGLRSPLTPSVFESLVWAIVGQQVNLRFAGQLRRTVIELAGTPHPSGMIAHPDAAAVAALDPAELLTRKFSRSKVEYLQGVARVVADGRLDLERLPELPAEEAAERLTGLRGIGPWTRNFILLRACGFPDCVPVGDSGLAAGLQKFFGLEGRPDAAAQDRLMQPFAPHRSLATLHFWTGWA
jgi:DNA-3-methyladenine glycosylase II